MRVRWIVPSSVALLSLALVLLWSHMASQALVPPGDSGAAGLKAPADADQTVHEVALDGAAGRLATVEDVSLVKTAASTRVLPGEVVTYTLAFFNSGSVAGTLDAVWDQLPMGVTFSAMTDASDVITTPFSSTPYIYWDGPFSIDPLAELTVQYVVTMPLTDGVTLVNNAWGYVDSTTVGPDSAEVKVGQTGAVFFPISLRNYSPPRFEESWEVPSPYWQPYLDHWDLNSEQWYLQDGVGVGGSTALKHTYWRGVGAGAYDALYMYLGPGSEGWTNYRYEAKVKMNNGLSQGLWFRGAYEESTTGQDPVQGYYLVWRTGGDYLKLSRIQAEGEWAYDFQEAEELDAVAYTFSTDVWYDIAVEVVGSNIKAFVDDELVIEWDDDTWSTGTVGAFCYRVGSALWDDILVTPLP